MILTVHWPSWEYIGNFFITACILFGIFVFGFTQGYREGVKQQELETFDFEKEKKQQL